MSCNGCRVLRKGCSEHCMLRQCLQGINSPQAQANATVFVAKFFGRAGLMSFISAVPEPQRPAVFQSLLVESVGRTINPVSGAVGLLWTGNWHICRSAVETVLRGGALRPLSAFHAPLPQPPLHNQNDNDTPESDVECPAMMQIREMEFFKGADGDDTVRYQPQDHPDLGVMLGGGRNCEAKMRSRTRTNSEESQITSLGSNVKGCSSFGGDHKCVLKLFV